MSARQSRKPKAVRQQVVVDYIRRMILDGRIAPGGQLPTHTEIQQKIGGTFMTIQRSFDRMAAEGFIRTQPKVGRFVADRPPHLSRYALIFNTHAQATGTGAWSRFYAAILQASRIVAARRRITLPTYFNVHGNTDSEDYQTLIRDMENHRLAGIIFTFSPHELLSTPLAGRHGLPVVNAHPLEGPSSVTRIPDGRHFLYRAVDTLLAEGRKRFAVITMPDHSYPDELEAALTSRGAITHPSWTHAVNPNHKQWVRNAVDAILNTHAALPPDALLITDDHLVEPVAEALDWFGVKVPEQMRVIGHWNFPLPYRGRGPVDLLGFDAEELVELWVDSIDAQRRGEKVAPLAMVPARFSTELRRQQYPQDSAGEPAEVSVISGSPF